MTESPLLALKDVRARYGAIDALCGVSLEVRRGEIVALIGSNGAGKSTLLMSVFSLPRACGGTIMFNGIPLHAIETHQVTRLGISLVPEGRRIFPAMTVLENLRMGAQSSGVQATAQMDEEALADACRMFPRLQERLSQRAGTLSGGEQQMLAIGRALMARPKLLLLDEPSLGLAPLVVRQIFKSLAEIRDRGVTVFLVEQNARHALKLADRAYVLASGKIQMSGSGEELLDHPSVKEAYLGGQ